MTQNPAGFSLKALEHYEQLLRTRNRFHLYDYGKKNNRMIYNSDLPPDYPLDQISVPVYVIYATEDLSVFPQVRYFLPNVMC